MRERLFTNYATILVVILLLLIALAGFLFTVGLWGATPRPSLGHVLINGIVSAASFAAMVVGLARWLRNRADYSFLVGAIVLSLLALAGVLISVIGQQA